MPIREDIRYNTITTFSFYRAKPSGAQYCQGKLSVHPSVCNIEVL